MEISSNVDKVMEELKEFQKAFIKIENDNGSTIVQDAQFTTIENKINTDRLSDSEEEAINEATYLEARQGKKIDQKNLNIVVDKLIRDYFEEVFK